MGSKLTWKLSLALLIAAPGAVLAGPFGLDMGQSYEQLARQMPLQKGSFPGAYRTPSVPKAHPDFGTYQLVIMPGPGLCKIMAAGKPIATSSYGREVMEQFGKLEAALADKYGAAERQDVLLDGSIWKEPRDWTMAMLKKERALAAYWGMNGEPLPDNLATISIETTMINQAQAYLMLTYEFKNAKVCYEAIRSQKNSAL